MKLVVFLRDDLDGQHLTGEVSAGQFHTVARVSLIQLEEHTAGIRGVRGPEGLKRGIARFCNIGLASS